MTQKVGLPTTQVLNAQHMNVMGLIHNGSRDKLMYSRALQDFTDGAHQFHGNPETLENILERLGVVVERVGDAERRLGAQFSESSAFLLAKDRQRTIECLFRDINFFALVAKEAQMRLMYLRLVHHANPESLRKPTSRQFRPRWAPSHRTTPIDVYQWEFVSE